MGKITRRSKGRETGRERGGRTEQFFRSTGDLPRFAHKTSQNRLKADLFPRQLPDLDPQHARKPGLFAASSAKNP
jgi:hypothetical protein